MLSGKQIILGVTGGIAAYKAAFLLREFQKKGAKVRVTMTPSATRFIGKETFAALSKHKPAVEIFPEDSTQPDSWTRHINWSEWADLFVIAPCTANTAAKIAGGMADNMLTATVTAARCPILICPTMDGEMVEAPAVKNNLETLKSAGHHLFEPEAGYLASGLKGKGRLPDTEKILDKCSRILSGKKGPLSGKKVVVTAGPTREHLDPVRFISNPSTGKMGFAMAEAAKKLGGDVTLLQGAVSAETPQGVAVKNFESTDELLKLLKKENEADVIIMAAAVSDFTPKEKQANKIKKEKGLNEIALQPTADILKTLAKRQERDQTIVGFAMETENLLENAAKKRKEKKMDWIVANQITDDGAGFASDANKVILLGAKTEKRIEGPKKEVAEKILSYIFGKR